LKVLALGNEFPSSVKLRVDLKFYRGIVPVVHVLSARSDNDESYTMYTPTIRSNEAFSIQFA